MSPNDLPEALRSLAWIDILGLLLVLGIGIAGLIKGAARYIIGLVSLVGGIVAALAYGDRLGAASWPVVRDFDDPVAAGGLLGCLLLFAGALLLGALVARIVHGSLAETSLGGFNRFLGFLLGGARGALYTGVAVVILMATGNEALTSGVESSYSLAYTRDAVRWGWPYIPEGMQDVLDEALDVQRDLPVR